MEEGRDRMCGGTWTDRHGEEGGEGADKGPAAELRVVTLSHYVSSASLR